MALDYLQPAPTQQGQGQQAYSPETLKMMREYSKALMSQKQKPTQLGFYSPWQGASDAMGDILGAWTMRDAAQKDRATHNIIGDEVGSQHTGYGNNTATASGGAGAGAPFTSDTQESQEEAQTRGRQPLGVQTASLDPSSGVSDAAMDLTARRETGKTGKAALFNMSPDTGGSTSYGPLGLNSKSGSAATFAKEHPELGLTAKPGTPEWDTQWRHMIAVNPDEAIIAHRDYHQKHIMAGISDDMIKRGVDPKIANDPSVQLYMADRKDQHNTIGLDRAIMYAKVSHSPEEFRNRMTQADIHNIPYNFPTYLDEHPDRVRGLANGIKMRHEAASALATADPDTTGRMVDFYKNGQGSSNTPPTQLAQNTPRFQNHALPTGRLQEETGELLRGLISRGQMDPSEAVGIAKQLDVLRKGNMPEYGDPNDLGLGMRREPGRMPAPYLIPGHPGKLTTDPNSNLPQIQRINPNTGQPETIIQFPKFQSSDQSQNTTPVTPGKATPAPATGATVQAPTQPTPTPQNAPATTPTPPNGTAIVGGPLTTKPPAIKAPPEVAGGPITTAPPSVSKGVQVASAEGGQTPFQMALAAVSDKGKSIIPTNAQIAQAEVAAGASDPNNWSSYVKESLSKPEIGSSYVPPNLQKLYKAAEAGDEKARNTLMDLKSAKAANLKKAEFTDTESGKVINEVDKSLVEGQIQGIKLAPSIKLANRIIKDEGFESGKLAGLVTDVRNVAGELKRINDRFKNSDGSLEYPWINDLIDKVGAKKSSPNEAFVKVISGSVLQSLRSMLGPNSGQFRVQELKLLEAAYGNPNISTEGNKVVMDMIDKINDRSIIFGKMANAYKQARGGALDANFLEAMDKYSEDHPTFNPEDYDKLLGIFQSGEGASEKEPEKKTTAPTPKQEYKLRPGFRLE